MDSDTYFISPGRENAIERVLELPGQVLKILYCPGIVYGIFTISFSAF
jgi:hypothetical protein